MFKIHFSAGDLMDKRFISLCTIICLALYGCRTTGSAPLSSPDNADLDRVASALAGIDEAKDVHLFGDHWLVPTPDELQFTKDKLRMLGSIRHLRVANLGDDVRYDLTVTISESVTGRISFGSDATTAWVDISTLPEGKATDWRGHAASLLRQGGVRAIRSITSSDQQICDRAANDQGEFAKTALILQKSTQTRNCIDMLKRLASMSDLALPGQGLVDLTLLTRATRLETLDLSDNGLTDLAPLFQLKNLTSLVAANNKLTKLPASTEWAQLTILNVSGNGLTNLSGVEKLTALEELDVSGNQIKSVDSVATAKTLVRFYANDNKLDDLAPLAGLTNLEVLHIANNKVADLRPLAQNSSLRYVKYLDFSNNPLSRGKCPIIGDSEGINTFCRNTFIDKN
jgi:hypothetical protein